MGNGPIKELPPRPSCTIAFRLSNESGSCPESWLYSISRSCKWVKFPMLLGTTPERLLNDSVNSFTRPLASQPTRSQSHTDVLASSQPLDRTQLSSPVEVARSVNASRSRCSDRLALPLSSRSSDKNQHRIPEHLGILPSSFGLCLPPYFEEKRKNFRVPRFLLPELGKDKIGLFS